MSDSCPLCGFKWIGTRDPRCDTCPENPEWYEETDEDERDPCEYCEPPLDIRVLHCVNCHNDLGTNKGYY